MTMPNTIIAGYPESAYLPFAQAYAFLEAVIEDLLADSAKTIFTEHVMKLIELKTLKAPAKAGGLNLVIDN